MATTYYVSAGNGNNNNSGSDPAQPLRTIQAAVNKLQAGDSVVIRGGVYGGKPLDANGVKELASIPTKEVLLAQLCGLLMSPISRTAVVLGALAAKKGEGEAVAA